MNVEEAIEIVTPSLSPAELRTALERIWADGKVRAAGNVVLWGTRIKGGYAEGPNLFYKKGRASGARRPKRKGHSRLSKNYGFFWHSLKVDRDANGAR